MNPNHGASIFIELQNFKAFESQLDNLDTILKKLNARADDTVAVMSRIESAFNVKLPKTTGLVQAATDILTATRELTKIGKLNLDPVVDNIEKLALTFTALPKVTKTQQVAISNYRDMIIAVNGLFMAIKLMDLKEVNSRLRIIETAFKNSDAVLIALPKVTDTKTRGILQLDAFFKIVTGVFKRITTELPANELTNVTKAFAAVGKMLQATEGIVTQAAALSGGKKSLVLSVLKRDLPQLFKGLKKSAEELVNLFSVFQRIQRPQAIMEVGRLFGRTGFLIEQVIEATKLFGKLEAGNIEKLKMFFRDLRPLANELRQTLNVLSAVERPKSLSGASIGISAIARLIQTLGKIHLDDEEKTGKLLNNRGPLLQLLRGFKPFIIILGEALNGLNNVQKGTTTVRSVGIIGVGLSQLLRVLRDVRAESSEIDRLIIFRRALTKYLRGIRPFFNILADALDALNTVRAPDNVRYVGRLTDALGELIGQLREIEPQNEVAQIILPNRRLTKFLRGIRPFFEILSDAFDSLSKIKSPENLKASGRLIDGLGEFIRQISTGFGEQAQLGRFALPSRRLTRFLIGIRPFFKILSDAFQELDKIKSPDNLKAVGNLLQGLQEILNELRSLPDQSPVYDLILPQRRMTRFLRGIRPFMRILTSAFAELDKIKSPENLRAVAVALDALGKFIEQMRGVEANQGTLRRLFGGSTQITKYLIGIKPFAKIIKEVFSELADFKGDAAKLAVASEALNGLSRLLQVIGKIDFNRGVKSDVRKNVVPIIREMVKALVDVSKRVKDADKALKVAESLNKLGNALAAFSKARNFEQTAAGIRKGLADIFAALNQANKVGGFSKGFASEGESGAKGFLNSIKRVLRIASPSKAMIEIGQNALAGFVKAFPLAEMSALGKKVMGAFLSGIKVGVQDLTTFFRGVPTQLAEIFSSAGNTLRTAGAQIFQQSIQAVTQGGIKGFLNNSSVGLAANFDQLLNQIKVFGKLSVDELSGVQNAILRFSAETIFDPTQSAEAFLGLQKAGLDVAESLAALPEIGNLAAAGQIGLADATTLAMGALNSFGLETAEMRRVVDAFAKGADISSAGVTDFGTALGFVGGTARQLKIPIEDMTAAIALLNDQNIRGERAGTGLRAILDSIINPSDEASKALDNLGINLRDADGNFVGLQSTILQFKYAIQRLREEGLGDVDITGILGSLGDRNAIEALFGLIADGSGTMIEFEDGSQRAAIGFEEYQIKLESANDAQTSATALMDTFKGQLESLRGSFETLLIKGLIPVLQKGLKPVISVGIKFLNFLSELPQPILSGVAAAIALGAALTTIVGIIGTLVGAGAVLVGGVFSAISVSLTTLSALLFTPLGLIAGFTALVGIFAAIASSAVVFTGLAAAGVVVYKVFRDIKENTDGLRDSFSALFDSLKSLGEIIFPLISSIGDFASAMFGASNGVKQFDNSTSEGGNGLKNFVDSVRRQVDRLTAALEEVKVFFDFFAATSTGNFDKFVNEYEDAADKIVNTSSEIIDIPFFGGEQSENTGNAEYAIKAGDTLIGIAQKYGVAVEELIEANDLVKASTGRYIIRAGENLKIPGQVAEESTEKVEELNRGLALGIGTNAKSVEETERQIGSLGRALLVFSKTKIFKRLFGDLDEGGMQKALEFTEQLERTFRRIKFSGERAFSGIGKAIFGDFKEGIRDIEVGLAGISAELIDLFETITGVDIGAGIENQLRSGNLIGAVKVALQPVIKAIREFLIDSIDEAVSYMLKFTFRRFLFPLNLLSQLGVPFFKEINDLLLGTFDVIGDIVQQFVRLTQGGASFGVALSTVFDDFFNIIKLNDFGSFADGLETILGLMRDTRVFDDANKAIKPLVKDVADFFSGVAERSGPAFEKFLKRLEPTIKRLDKAFARLGKALKPIFDAIVEFVKDNPTEILIGLLSPLIGAAAAIAGAIAILVGVFAGFAEAADPFMDTLRGIGDIFNEVVEGFKTGNFDGVVEALERTFNSLVDTFESFFSGFASGVLDAGQLFADLLGIDVDVAAEANRIADDIVGALTDAFESAGDTASGIYDAGKNAVNDLIDGINDFIPDDVKRVGSDIISGISEGVGDAYQSGKDLIGNLIDGLNDFIPDDVKKVGSDIIDGIGEGIGDLFQKGKDAFSDLVNGVKDFLGIKSPSKKFKEIGESIIQGLEQGLTGLLDSLNRVFFNIICCPSEFAQDLLGFVRNIFTEGKNLLEKSQLYDFAVGVASKVISTLSMLPGFFLAAVSVQAQAAGSIVSYIAGIVSRAASNLLGGDVDFDKIATGIKDGILGVLDGNMPFSSTIANLADKLVDFLGLNDIDFGEVDFGKFAENLLKGLTGFFGIFTIDELGIKDFAKKFVDSLGIGDALADIDLSEIDFGEFIGNLVTGLITTIDSITIDPIETAQFVTGLGEKLGLWGGDNQEERNAELRRRAEEQAVDDAAEYQTAYTNAVLNRAFKGELNADDLFGVALEPEFIAENKEKFQAAIDNAFSQVTDLRARVQLTELQFIVDANGEGLETNINDLINNLGLEPTAALPLDELLNFRADATPDEEQSMAIGSALTAFLENAFAQGFSQEDIATIVSEFDLTGPVYDEILAQFGIDPETIAGLKQAGNDVVSGVAQGMTTPQALAQVDLSTKAVSARFQSALSKGLEIFEGETGSAYTRRIGNALMISLGEGMEEEFDNLEEIMENLFDLFEDKFDELFDFSGSRSYFFYRMGENFMRSISDGISNALYMVETPLNNLSLRFVAFQQRISSTLLLLRGDLSRFSTDATLQMNRLIVPLTNLEIQFLELTRAIGLAAINLRLFGVAVQQTDTPISELVANMVAASLPTTTTSNVPGRAEGGGVDRGVLYEINEALRGGVNRTELYTTRSGKQYLLPGESGRVTPLSDVSGGGGGGTTIVFDNEITVTIGGSQATPEQITAAVQSGVDQAQQAGFRYRAVKAGKL